MPLVLDCSIALSWFFADERTAFTDAALDLAAHEECWVPAIWRLEFPNALLAAERRRRLTREERLQVLEEASRLKLKVDAAVHDMRAISSLAGNHGLSTYDAAYLELAARQAAALVTLDRTLAEAGSRAGVVVHAPGRTSAAQLRGRYNI
jgi:predicted nucleic acid-binding protein